MSSNQSVCSKQYFDTFFHIKTLFFRLGSYRFNDGQAMQELAYSNYLGDNCKRGCTMTFKIYAPLYVQNSQCSLMWSKSSFLKGSQTWQHVSGSGSGFIFKHSQNFEGVEIKVIHASFLIDQSTTELFGAELFG